MNTPFSASDKKSIILRTEDLAGTSTEQKISLWIENTNSDKLEIPEKSNKVRSSVISTNLNQINCLYQEKAESDSKTEYGPKNISKITALQKDNFDKPIKDYSTKNENSISQNNRTFPESDHQKQENATITTELPSDLRTDKKASNYPKKQISPCISENIPDGKYFLSQQKPFKTLLQETETFEIKNEKNATRMEEFSQQQNDTNSSENQLLPENLKPRKNIPGIYALYDLISHSQEPQEKSDFPSEPHIETSIRNHQELTVSEPSKEEHQILDHFKTKTCPIKIPVATDNANNANNANRPENRINLFEHDNEINFKVSQKCPEVNVTKMFYAKNSQMKPPLQTPLPPTPLDQRTDFKWVVLEPSLDLCQSIPELNRTFDLNNEKLNIIANPRTKKQIYNSGPISLQNKFVNDNRTCSLTNLCNINKAEINSNQKPLNVIDTRSIFPENNLNKQNLVRPIAANIYPQNNQLVVGLSMSANMTKENLESDNLSPFLTDAGIHSGFSHNQFSHSKGSDSSSVKYIHYSDNGPLRLTNVCNRPTNVSKGSLSIQPSGVCSTQSFQQYSNRPESSGLLRWPKNKDQTMGQEKYLLLQTYSNSGISSSYQNTPNSFNQNLTKDSDSYSNPVSTNETRQQKMTHSDTNLCILSAQCNPEKRSNPNIEDIKKEQNLIQNFSGYFSPMRQMVNPSKDDLIQNQPNDNSLSSVRTSFQRKSVSEDVHNQTDPQNKKPLLPLPPLSQEDPQLFSQNKSFPTHLQRPTQAFSYYDSSFPMTKYNPVMERAHSPLPRVNNIASFSSPAGYSQSHPVGSKPPDDKFMNISTATITTTATSTLLSTKESPRKTDLTTFDKGRNSDSQRLQNKIHESDIINQNAAISRYLSQANSTKFSQSDARFSTSEPHAFQPVYTKDIHPLSTDTAQTVYNSNNSGNIMTWSLSGLQNSDLDQFLYATQKGFTDYYPLDPESNSKTVNLNQQSNNQIMTGQSYNNYIQPVQQSLDNFLEKPRPLKISNFNSIENSSVYTHNSNVEKEHLKKPQMEDQTKPMTEKFPILSEMSTRIDGRPVNSEVEKQDTQTGVSTQIEACTIKPIICGQFENNNLSKKVPRKTADEENSSQVSLPLSSTTTANSILKTVDFFGQSNLGISSEKSIFFSDLDPLFSSSLLTNDLTYFPESNSIFDQYFQDNASSTMAMEYSHEDQTQGNMNSLDQSRTTDSQQPHQLTPLLDISNNKCRDSPASIFSFHENQFFIPRSFTEMNQVNNSNRIGNEDNMFEFNHNPDQFAGNNVSYLNPTPFSSQLGIISENVHSNSNPMMTFSAKTASPLVKPPGNCGTAKGMFGKNAGSKEEAETKFGIQKKGRQKKERSDYADKYNKNKSLMPKGTPRRRGRPPKSRNAVIPSFDTTQKVTSFTSNKIPISTNSEKSLNIAAEASTNISTPGMGQFSQIQTLNPPIYNVNLENSPLPVSNCNNHFVKSEPHEYTTGIYRPETQTGSLESLLVPYAPLAKVGQNAEAQQELSEQEVINVVTKRLETISRNEKEKSSDQIKDFPLNSIHKDLDASLHSSMKCASDSHFVSNVACPEDEALSKEKMLMRAYIELKKKLEERMNKSLWRQSYLRRNKPKISDRFRRLSKKECMTAYSGTTSWELDDLFPRYCNRPPGLADSEKLVAKADSTSIDDERENSENLKSGPDKKLLNTLDLFPIANEELISSTELSEPKDQIKSLPLPSMIDVVRTRLTDDLLYSGRISQNSSFPEEIKDLPDHPNLLENQSYDCSETVIQSHSIDKDILSNESKQLDLLEKGDISKPQLYNSPPVSTTITNLPSSLEADSLSPMLPPPPALMQVVYFTVKKENIASSKVGPNIVENAKICFESIGNCLKKAESDFDSFLISYANIVQGLLNCGADQYSQIKAIVLKEPNQEPNKSAVENNKKANFDSLISEEADAERSSVLHQDLDASEIQGDPTREKSTININDFSCNYPDIVKAILRSRVDEYRNIKQALSRNICSAMDVNQESTKTFEKCESNQRDSKEMLALPEPHNSKEALDDSTYENKRQMNIPESKISTRKTSRKCRNETKLARNRNQPDLNKEVSKTPNNQKLACKKDLMLRSDYLTSEKESNSSNKTKSSKLRIILNSSYFIEQNDESSILKTERKKSKFLSDEDNPSYKDTKLTLSGDENVVEESTGDYVIGLDSQSESERSLPVDYKNFSNTVGNLESNHANKIGTTNISYGIQSNHIFNTRKSCHLSELESDSKSKCESSWYGVHPKTAITDPGFGKMFPTAKPMESGGTKIRKTRNTTAAGVSIIKYPCGCCNNETISRAYPMANQLKDNTKSFKTRNRSKIIKPKSASVLKKFERSRKLDKYPEKVISKHWNDPNVKKEKIDEDKSKENRESLKVRNNSAGDLELQASSKVVPVENRTTENLLMQRILFNQPDFASEYEEIGESEREIMVDSDDSDISWKPKRPHKRATRAGPKKKKKTRPVIVKHPLLPYKKNSKTSLFDSITAIRNEKTKAEERTTKLINETGFKEFDSCDNNTHLKNSLRNILPILKSSSPSETPSCKNDLFYETVNSLGSMKAVNKTSKAITPDDTNNYIWPNEKENSMIFSLDDTDVDIPVRFGVQHSQCGPSIVLKESDLKTNAMVSWGNVGETDGKEETKSSEGHQKSLVKRRSETSASTKRQNIKSAVMFKNCSGDISPNTVETHPVFSNDNEEIREEPGILEAIDKRINFPIRAGNFERNSSNSIGINDNQKRRLVSKSRTQTLKVKLPISLNQKREIIKNPMKTKSLNLENKLIIRKNSLKKSKNVVQHLLLENKTEREKSFPSQDTKKEIRSVDTFSSSDKDESLILPFSGSYTPKRTRSLNRKSTSLSTTKKTVTEDETIIKKLKSEGFSAPSQREALFSSPENAEFSIDFNNRKNRNKNRVKRNLHVLDNELKGDKFNLKEATSDNLQNIEYWREDSLVRTVCLTDGSENKTEKFRQKPRKERDSLCSRDSEKIVRLDLPKTKKTETTKTKNISNSTTDKKGKTKSRLIVSGTLKRYRHSDLEEPLSNIIKTSKNEKSPTKSNEIGQKQKRSRRSGMECSNYQCTYCSKSFKKPSQLLYHTRWHTGVRPFVCSQCNKAFVSKSHLSRHQQTHSTERKRVCPTCEQKFTKTYDLVVHQLIHSGIKLHRCVDCLKEFRTKPYLNRHRRKYHQIKTVQEKET